MSDFVTPWTAACQASLSITNSWGLLKRMSIESVMPSNRLILCCPLLLLPSIFPSIRVFSNESALRLRWPKYWSFSPGLHSQAVAWPPRLSAGRRESGSQRPWLGEAAPQRGSQPSPWVGPGISASSGQISFVAQTVKRLSTMPETRVRTLGQGRSSGEGNGNPFHYSCLENPMDRGAWWAAVHGVTKSWT